MAIFGGRRVTQRGGAGAGRGDNPHNIEKAVADWNPDADRAKLSPVKKAEEPNSGRMRFDISGKHGGGHLMVSPNEKGGHDISRWSPGFKNLEYHTKGAQFSHKPGEGNDWSGELMWHGGSNEGAGTSGNFKGLSAPEHLPSIQP